MIELTVLHYLTANMSVPCYMEEPETKPASYIIVAKLGSGMNDGISSAVVALKSYASSLLEAAELNEKAKKAMLAMPDSEANVSKVSLNSDYNNTDTETKRYRYQAVFDIIFMEE